ncbi:MULTISPECIES: beta-ketoacyl-ACP synthase III [Microbulbifer]|uniref:beta-ketoacyl-ACP synthase III n=1 Tax=Microbulbifer TaxID=48073 RepID=UPI001C957CBC|nr:beta-ketoacyl-ACP synthase III [Microbulbifer agarilyticus]MBY6191175.1 beta-ketoacyl-ACP synthase III [Microbulbifer agarilyticus]MCA0900364.1 beta-ketoacyl-ACP synthase III [Microbulbifer agarilyticus]
MSEFQLPRGIVISGTGLWTPPEAISNEELVVALNAHAEKFNREHADAIESGQVKAKSFSSAEFIEKASGIKNRYVISKEGILDPNRMRPYLPERADDELCLQAEMGLNAAKLALEKANKKPEDIDAVIVGASYLQRAYPAISIEIQSALGIDGFAFDMEVACSSATFALQRAVDAISSGSAKSVLVINPELASPQIDFSDRDSHFIFGDVAVATVVERKESCNTDSAWEILGTKAKTVFSNNIRSNFSYTARAADVDPFGEGKLFRQNGRKVFKEVCPMAAAHLESQVQELGFEPNEVNRWWLHQANINMNLLIAKKLMGNDASPERAPIVLDQYANTGCAGSIIAFNLHNDDLPVGSKGVICSFGAGYSIGSLALEKIAV